MAVSENNLNTSKFKARRIDLVVDSGQGSVMFLGMSPKAEHLLATCQKATKAFGSWWADDDQALDILTAAQSAGLHIRLDGSTL
jgi:hypothetical protein